MPLHVHDLNSAMTFHSRHRAPFKSERVHFLPGDGSRMTHSTSEQHTAEER